MSIAGGIVAFVIIWMVVLFMVLPWGVRNPAEMGEQVDPGHDPGAPVRPMLWRKIAVTTAISAALWAAVFYILEYRVVTLDDLPI